MAELYVIDNLNYSASMADDPQFSQQDTSAAAASMASTQGMFSASTLNIPDEVKAQFPELIDLITHSESMNDEERQYWINILPIMTPEQLQNLKGILDNERQQLSAIDAKYDKQLNTAAQAESLEKVEQDRKARAEQRLNAEQQAKAAEEGNTENLLKEIEGA